ncbi:MAG: SUMF1/EgtB/PvdO family nonheme iron enzyme [Verrucomicrobiota bacterium]
MKKIRYSQVQTYLWRASCSNAVEFAESFRELENLRLPTTNEWLCRCFLHSVGKALSINTNTNTIPVDQTTSNPLGFYGMNDNVLEWCSDVWI